MRRVLHLWSGNLFGGVERVLAEVTKRAQRYEHHVGLSFEGALSNELRKQSTIVHLLGNVRISRPWTVVASRRRLQGLLASERFSAVIAHGFWPHLVWSTTVKRNGAPLILCQHDMTAGKHWIERVGKRIRPDRYIANSRASEAALLELMPGLLGDVVYPPVAVAGVRSAEVRQGVRAEFGADPDSTVILQVGRLEWYKGHWLLLESLKRLTASADWQCWFVGGAQRAKEARYLAYLKRLAAFDALRGRVRFVGQRDDVSRLLQGADVFCQPNVRPEAFGMVFVEALGSRLPVVGVASGAVPEIVDDSCGRVVQASPAAIAAALTELLLDRGLRETLGSRGPGRAEALCSPDRQVGRFEQAISEAAG